MSTRIAIVSSNKCKPSKCNMECKKCCPVVKIGKQCIVVSPKSQISQISELLCIGCGICTKKCPFNAIKIINLPNELENETIHRYGENMFKLYRLPTPRTGQILGIVGANGTGKSTAMKILSRKIKPNLGSYSKDIEWKEISNYFRGSELQNFFTKDITCVVKPQYVDYIPQKIEGTNEGTNEGTILEILSKFSDPDYVIKKMNLTHISHRKIDVLSGGELQRFAIALCLIQNKDLYIFDEPSSYLDIKQRVQIAQVIREFSEDKPECYNICVEHDLSILDYLSDYVCILYGESGCYGVSTMPFSVKDGLNIFLDGFIPTENVRFRSESLDFNIVNQVSSGNLTVLTYPNMKKSFDDFILTIEEGSLNKSEIIVCLGENGGGKTTFVRILTGFLQDDENQKCFDHKVSYKPQKILPKFTGTVKELLLKKISNVYHVPQFISDVIKPLKINDILDQEVQNLSGGELQIVAITICLGTFSDIYFLDEPSAYLDSEQRIIVSKVIKQFIIHSGKSAIIVEHDFIMSSYLADRVIVFEGNPGKNMTAKSPQNLQTGMNKFLKNLDITFRRDSITNRPRINKKNSVKDQEQKKNNEYF